MTQEQEKIQELTQRATAAERKVTQLESSNRQLADKVRYLDEMLTESEIQWRADGAKLDAANTRIDELESQIEAIDEALGVTAAHKAATQENAVDAIDHLKSELAKARERIATLESQYEACVQLNRWESEDYERQLKREYAALCNLQDRAHELARALEKLGYVYPAYELRALLDALSDERPKPDSGKLPAVHLNVSGDVFRAGGTTDDSITWTIYSEAAMGHDAARTQVYVGGRKVADISVHAHAHDLVEEVQEVGAALVWSAIRAVRMRGGEPASEQPATEAVTEYAKPEPRVGDVWRMSGGTEWRVTHIESSGAYPVRVSETTGTGVGSWERDMREMTLVSRAPEPKAKTQPFTWTADDRAKLVTGARVTVCVNNSISGWAKGDRVPHVVKATSLGGHVMSFEGGPLSGSHIDYCDPTTIIPPESDDAEPSVYDAKGVVT